MSTMMKRLLIAAALLLLFNYGFANTIQAGEERSADASRIGWIIMDGPLAEKPNPFGWLMGEKPGDSLRGMIAMLDDVAERDDIEALVIHIKELALNRSQLLSVTDALGRIRDANKAVYVFAEVYGPGELILAAAADDVLIQEAGFISFPGMYMQEIFLADTLDMIGLKADYVQVGDFKGASEQMTRTSPSPEWSKNIDALLDDLWDQMSETVRTGRGFTHAQWHDVLDKAWALEAGEAVQIGLVDREIDVLDLRAYVRKQHQNAKITTKLGSDGSDSAIDVANPFAILQLLTAEPDNTPERDTIAVVHIAGTIIDGESTPASFFGGESVGSRTIRKALKTIEDDDLVKGLILRINSPGGSALASEIIWQGVRRVAEKKPVYISVGSMAASGGYYIAVSGDKIFVDQSSIVGSIGVVGGKMVMGGLYDKLKVGVTTRSRGPHANLMGSYEPWTEEERDLIRDMMTNTYDRFSMRVVQGRGDKVDMSTIAEGRIFTGRQAMTNGMADGFADFDGTIDRLADSLGLDDGYYDVMTFPGPMSFEDMMEQLIPFAGANAPSMKSFIEQQDLGAAAIASALKTIFGESHWPQVRDSLNGIMLLREEHVLLISPSAIIIE